MFQMAFGRISGVTCVSSGTQCLKDNKARTTKVKEEGVNLASLAPTVTTTPPPNVNYASSSPATSLPGTASSELTVDNFVVDNKNAPRFVFLLSQQFQRGIRYKS